jgi:hypothetical protein
MRRALLPHSCRQYHLSLGTKILANRIPQVGAAGDPGSRRGCV